MATLNTYALLFLIDKVHKKMRLESISLWCYTAKGTFWWWTPRMWAFYLRDEEFSIKHTLVVNNTCLVASLLDVHGFFTTPKVLMNPLMISFWATTNFEFCLNLDFGKKSTIEYVSTLCITNLLERGPRKKCNSLFLIVEFQ